MASSKYLTTLVEQHGSLLRSLDSATPRDIAQALVQLRANGITFAHIVQEIARLLEEPPDAPKDAPVRHRPVAAKVD